MKKIFHIIILLIPFFSYGQISESRVLTDTSIVYGYVKEGDYIGRYPNYYCKYDNEIFLQKGTGLIVSGIKNCKGDYTAQFYTVIFKNREYNIRKANLIITEDYYNQISSMQSAEADSFRNVAIRFSNILFVKGIYDVSTYFKKRQPYSNKVLTDTSTVIGYLKEDCSLSSTSSYHCYNDGSKLMNKGNGLIISGIKNCQVLNSSEIIKLFSVFIDNEEFYIEKEKLVIDETYYEIIESMPLDMQDSFRNHAKYLSNTLYLVKLKKAIKFIDDCNAKGLTILDWSFYDESEYTKGTSVKLEVYNPTKKIVKYMWFTFVGYNAVDDKIVDTKRGVNITMQGIGPLKPKETGTYKFEYVWFTDLVEKVIISNIKIQYMDGSIKTISNPKGIMMSDEYYKKIIFKED